LDFISLQGLKSNRSRISRTNQALLRARLAILSMAILLVLFIAMIQACSAQTIPIDTSEKFDNAVARGGTSDTIYCLRWPTTTPYQSVGYGAPNYNCPGSINVNPGGQSGFTITDLNPTSATVGTPFAIARFTHHNNPINIVDLDNDGDLLDNCLGTVDLTINLVVGGTTTPFKYTINLDETANSRSCGYGGDCPYVCNSYGCGDGVWWLSPTSSGSCFSYAGNTYTLELEGWRGSSASSCYTTGNFVSVFNTYEQQQNYACIWAKITQCTASITTQPSPQDVCPGEDATFSVIAAGSPLPLSYQWYKVGTPDTALSDGAKYSGTTTATLTVNDVTNADAGNYYVKVNTVCYTCGVTATSNTASLTVSSTPTITSQPSSQTVCEDGSATFSVTATGAGTLSYQWYLSTNSGSTWSLLSGQTGSSLTLNPVTATIDNYRYRVEVTGRCGSATSEAAILTVARKPIVSVGPDITICEINVPVSLTGTNSGGPASYQWSTSGTGTFSAPTALATNYNPSQAEIDAGIATVTLTATGSSPCGSSTSSDSMTITIIHMPTPSIGVTFPV